MLARSLQGRPTVRSPARGSARETSDHRQVTETDQRSRLCSITSTITTSTDGGHVLSSTDDAVINVFQFVVEVATQIPSESRAT